MFEILKTKQFMSASNQQLKLISAFLILLAAFLMLSVSAYARAPSPSERLRYQVTVTVETPEGVKTGNAIREASIYREISVFPGAGGTFRHVTKGEAAVVDLGKRGVLISMISDEQEARFVFKNLYQSTKPEPIAYPYLQGITFTDLSDVKTATSVGPKNISKVFGAGVALKSVTIEKTESPVTLGNIYRWLPWLRGVRGYISGKNISGPKLYEYLLIGNFRKG